MKIPFRLQSAALALTIALAACSTTIAPPQDASPRLTFEGVVPFAVAASAVDVVNSYDSSVDGADVSSMFPTPPDIVLRRYAENRLKPAGGYGRVLKFEILAASVHHQHLDPEYEWQKILKSGDRDRFDVEAKIRVYAVTDDGTQTPAVTQTFRRSLTIPSSLSIADRESDQIGLLETLMRDVDREVTRVLQQEGLAAL